MGVEDNCNFKKGHLLDLVEKVIFDKGLKEKKTPGLQVSGGKASWEMEERVQRS